MFSLCPASPRNQDNSGLPQTQLKALSLSSCIVSSLRLETAMNTVLRICLTGPLVSLLGMGAIAQTVKLGAASYYTAPKTGDRAVPPALQRAQALQNTPAQTSQWYSTVVYNARPEAIFVQPLTVKPTAAGLEMSLPVKQVKSTERRDVEIRYPHSSPHDCRCRYEALG